MSARDFAAILREHRPRREMSGLIHSCTCNEWNAPDSPWKEDSNLHHTHVAAVLQAAVREAVGGLLDAYNRLDDDDAAGWECEPEDRWRFGRDLRALIGPAQ